MFWIILEHSKLICNLSSVIVILYSDSIPQFPRREKHTDNRRQVMLTGKPSYIAGKLRLRDESERELRAWGGRTVETPAYTLETSRAGFVYRGGKLYNSVSRSLREETSIARFKEGAKKWVTAQIPVRPGR